MSKIVNTENGEKKKRMRTGEELEREEIYAFADAFAESFREYPLFEYFSGKRYKLSGMKCFWEVSLRTMFNSAYFVMGEEGMSSVALLVPDKKSSVSLGQYIKAGGLRVVFKLGLFSVIRMLRFESFAAKIKRKYATEDCWYLYAFVTVPEFRGRGLGSGVLQEMMRFLDSRGQDCYLETLSEVNVGIYEKYGFELKETAKLPNTDLTVYAMVRRAG